MAAVLLDTLRNKTFCCATILSDQYILTTANCIQGQEFKNFIDMVKVIVGVHDMTKGNRCNLYQTDIYKMESLSGRMFMIIILVHYHTQLFFTSNTQRSFYLFISSRKYYFLINATYIYTK